MNNNELRDALDEFLRRFGEFRDASDKTIAQQDQQFSEQSAQNNKDKKRESPLSGGCGGRHAPREKTRRRSRL